MRGLVGWQRVASVAARSLDAKFRLMEEQLAKLIINRVEPNVLAEYENPELHTHTRTHTHAHTHKRSVRADGVLVYFLEVTFYLWLALAPPPLSNSLFHFWSREERPQRSRRSGSGSRSLPQLPLRHASCLNPGPSSLV